MSSTIEQISRENEKIWSKIGSVSQNLHEEEKAIFSYESVLKHNHFNVDALQKIAKVYKEKGDFINAIEHYRRILNVESNNSDVWSEMGHCYLLMNDLQKSYSAYHQALYKAKLQNKESTDPKTWYGIGILYERFGYLENAEECFVSILQTCPDYDKRSEVFFRLGMIFKMKKQFKNALESFEYILDDPPNPLTKADIFYQIGHIRELEKDFNGARENYEKSLEIDQNHSSVLQQLGWLYFRDDIPELKDLEKSVAYFQKSIDSCSENGLTWYLLGRCYMKQKKYKKAFDAYQQSVFRDGRNPLFWCSIGILYFQINQQQDALDAYSKAIKLNDRISEVWYNLGTLYESCNQLDDALDAYRKASELNPNEPNIKKKIMLHNAKNKAKQVQAQSMQKKIVSGTKMETNTIQPNSFPQGKFPHGVVFLQNKLASGLPVQRQSLGKFTVPNRITQQMPKMIHQTANKRLRTTNLEQPPQKKPKTTNMQQTIKKPIKMPKMQIHMPTTQVRQVIPTSVPIQKEIPKQISTQNVGNTQQQVNSPQQLNHRSIPVQNQSNNQRTVSPHTIVVKKNVEKE